ncbi:MAG: NAD(P)/FAD-dependent oxidoreductase [Labilithrix sp.]|nr:NAD(P)/FAD-dependent oxidoreductase [Labilithrix sp.]
MTDANERALENGVDVEVVIVGTGFSGLCMAIQLVKHGRRSFVLLEQADDVGGTWRENHYPGCACDVPSHLYSFSFEPNPAWSRTYAPQAEILTYLRHCADKYGIRPHIRFRTTVLGADLDEARALWRVRLASGETITARHLVLGIGALSRPSVPELPGLERFRGKTFHSATWDHGYGLTGKTVAAIGTGASAIQFVPRIVPQVKQLHLFQRTAPWVLPKLDREVGAAVQQIFRAVPPAQRLYRNLLWSLLEATSFGFVVKPELMKMAARAGRRHIERQIKNPRLRDVVTPRFTPGCKRILLSNDYYSALDHDHVEVVSDRIREVVPEGIVSADGKLRELDAIIFGTGFRVTERPWPLDIRGRGGITLNEAWKNGIEAYRGTTIAGFPNTYHLMGPNTGLGNNSMVFMIEAQVDYVLRCMQAIEKRGARLADVRPAAQASYNAGLQARMARSVWGTGCQSWYLDENGRNSTLWPGFTSEFWLRTRRMPAADHVFDPPPDSAPVKEAAE